MKRKPWGYGGDSLLKRGRFWVLDLGYKGQVDKNAIGPPPTGALLWTWW